MPKPAMPSPNRAKVAGSGTVVEVVVVDLTASAAPPKESEVMSNGEINELASVEKLI